ncbi:MAG: S8 family serine peptidase [Dehalococcoidia bacterium]
MATFVFVLTAVAFVPQQSGGEVAAAGIPQTTALTASPEQTPSSDLIDINAAPPGRGGPIASSDLRAAIGLHQAGVSQHTDTVAGDYALVEVVHDGSPIHADRAVRAVGGTVRGHAAGVVEAAVPLNRIATLEAQAGVLYVRTPLRASVPAAGPSPQLFIGDEIAETNADAWHIAGYFGAGTKVGIIDFFDGDLWSVAQTAGEVPAPAGTFCRFLGSPCNVFDPALGDAHGIATSEIVHEMAPQAEIYIAFAWTTSDTQAAVDYFASQGVDVLSRSLTSTYDGAGDGTGPLAAVVDSAVSQGMVWVNSAGNSASASGTSGGSYWRSSWSDTDGDGFLNFSGNDEVLNFYCGFLNGLRWNDWGLDPTDYDVYIFDTPGAVQTFTPKYSSVNDQGVGFDPLEIVDDGPSCSGGSDLDHLAIHLFDPGGGTAGDVIELMGNGTSFEYSQNPYSASGPASDSASPGMMSVGAMTGSGPTIATYSSQGPTNDGRIKPDLAASSCVDSYAYQPGCFAGTSASAPGVAGATALVIGSGVATGPASARSWLLANAITDRGVVGPDNVYGAGELFFLPPPPDADSDAKTDAADNCPNWPNTTQALPDWPVGTGDPDCDGFSSAAEVTIGTNPLLQCSTSVEAWPPDLVRNGTINILDVTALKPVFGQSVPPAAGRNDIVPDSVINILDVTILKPFFGKTCT